MTADIIAEEMGNYCLLHSNCQHFCEKFLTSVLGNHRYQPMPANLLKLVGYKCTC